MYILPCHTAWKFHLHNIQYDITCIRLPIRYVELLFAFLAVKWPLLRSNQWQNIMFHHISYWEGNFSLTVGTR